MKTADGGRKAKAGAAAAAAGEAADWRWADPNELKVNPLFRGLIPLQARGEYLALGESIKAEGCRDPLLVWEGKDVVLDGHTRRELCVEHKQRVKVRGVELPDERAAVEYILRIQRQRRNLSREAMSYFRGSEYNAVKRRRGGRPSAREAKARFDPVPTTAALLAAKYGASEKTIKRDAVFARLIDRIVLERGDPEVKRRLLGADVRLTLGAAGSLLRMEADERRAALEHVLEFGELPRAMRESAAAKRPKDAADAILARLKTRGPAHTRSVVRRLAQLVGLEVVEKAAGE